MATRVGLLGPPIVHHDDRQLEPPRGKTTALLLYLAYADGWSSRTELLDLFWPDTVERQARSNLRSLLSRSVKRLPYADALVVEDTRLRWRVPTDVQAFRGAIRTGRWAEAVRLYRGELLQGLWLADADEFEAWLTSERRSVRELWREAVFQVAGELADAGRWLQASDALERLRQDDPLDEEALRRSLHALHRAGRRSQALDAFGSFREWLERELGSEPEAATSRLVAAVARAEPGYPLDPDTSPAASLAAPDRTGARLQHNLPEPPTALVGRVTEHADIAALLATGDGRLVTLVGPGGVGKTRLALAVAHGLLAAFEDGVRFVSCASVHDPELMVFAVADALSLPLIGPGEPQRQLLELLHDRRLLLVLDNLEQLGSDVGLIREMLAAAPGLRLLATSRERLNLLSEHVVDLAGLPVPDGGVPDAATYDALRLFAQCAARSRSDFVLGDTNLAPVVRICRLVAGLPLAIELAASWLRVVSPSDIADEIERSIDILRAPLQDVPARHTSIRAVFDYSWRVLTREQQAVLTGLAVFEGSFTREAAGWVAGATLPALAGLVNKSLVRSTATGRYHLHPLVRQYLLEKLADRSGGVSRAQAAHGRYYSDFMAERLQDLNGGRQLGAVQEIEEELDNVRAAWSWALEQAGHEHFGRHAAALSNFYMYRSRYQEWRAAYQEAADRLLAETEAASREPATVDPVSMFVLTHLGWSEMRLGRFAQAESVLRRAQEAYDRRGIPPPPEPASDPALPLSLIACVRGDLDAAVGYGQRALRTSLATGHLHNQRIARYALARAALAQQRFEDGRAHARAAYELCRQAGDRWFMADCHVELGYAAFALGDDATARHHYASGFRICQEFGNRGGMAEALNRLGLLALRREDFGEAQDTFRRSLTINEAVHEGKELARALSGLGDALLGLGQVETAPGYYRQALKLAAEMRSRPIVLSVARGTCQLLLLTGHDQQAQSLRSELGLPSVVAEADAFGDGGGSTVEVNEAVGMLLDALSGPAAWDDHKAAP